MPNVFSPRPPLATDYRPRPARLLWLVATLLSLVLLTTDPALAGGGPENVVVIVDPTVPESMYVGRHYQQARGIPDRNLLYMAPGGRDYPEVASFQIPALLGTLTSRGIAEDIDYVVIPPGGSFYVSTPNLIDGLACPAPVRRLSISSVYTLAFQHEEILAGDRRITEPNRYHSTDLAARAFDAQTRWWSGSPSERSDARRYLIGFQLGYSGPRGNPVHETVAMIDRSVAVDGTHPAGTFYLMRTDDIRSTPRHRYYDRTAEEIARLGGKAEVLYKIDDQVAVLPHGRQDVLGVMTGAAGPRIDQADMTLLPGSFADHLTSFAGRFDTGSQTKMARWIAKGASGSMGTVEEPCVFGEGTTGKFPHPFLFPWYLQGMSLGESLLRSIQWAPYQSLFYGDPLTRPFAAFPEVMLPGAPAEPVSGVIELRPVVVPAEGGAPIATLDLLVDGARRSTIAPGAAFRLDTTVLADGHHDLRVVAREDSPVETQGRWLGALMVDNRGRTLRVDATPSAGDLATSFAIDVQATGGDVARVRLLANGRVVAAVDGDQGSITLPGHVLGAGPVRLVAIAEHTDGTSARSAPTELTIAFDDPGPPVGDPAPVAYGYTADALPGQPKLLDLPAHDPSAATLRYEILESPAQATLERNGPAWLLRPAAAATALDTLTFRVVTGTVASAPATIDLRYCEAPAILAPPEDVTVCPSRQAAFSVRATGRNLTYQWSKDGRPIDGATDARLAITEADADDVGEYAVEVTRWCGDVVQRRESSSAQLALETQPEACRSTIWLPIGRVD